MSVRNPRLRLVIGRHGRLLAAVLAVVAVAALVGAGSVYTAQPTETVTQQTDRQTVTTTTSSSAVVTAEDALWPQGTVLRDQPVYLQNASPNLTVGVETRVDGADDAEVTHRIVLSTQAVRSGQVFYAVNRTLASNTERGRTVRTNATVDVPELRERVRNVSDRIGPAGLVTVQVVVHTSYETDPGESSGYEGNETLATPLALESNAYALGDHPSAREDHSRSVTTEVTRPRNWSMIWGLALVGIVALAGAGWVLSQRPSSIDLERARHDLHRRQYEEWISPGIIPMGIQQQFIELTSLEDVVDVAIDTQERVVYDQRRELYAVISENVVYYFSPGGSWMETAFPGMRSRPGDGVGGDGVGGDDSGGLGGGVGGGELGGAGSDFGEPGGGEDLGGDFEDAFGDFPGDEDDGEPDEASED